MVSAAIAAALLLGTGLGLGLGWRWRGRAGEQGQSPLRLTIAPPPSHDFSVFPAAVSPDGRTVAFAASKGDTTRLFLRRLDRFDAVAIPGSETGSTPTFSANGRWIFFGVNAEIRRAPVAGGPAVTIGTAPNFINTLQWLGPDTLVVVGAGGGLVLFPAGGGKATVLTALDTLRGEITHRSPLVLPGGGLAFAVALEDGSQGRIAITGPERRGWKYLPPGVEGDPKAYLDPGYILFEPRGGGLQAVPVASAGTPSSEPVRVAEGGFLYAVSAAGTAVSFSGVSTTRPVWVDSLGRITPTAIEPAPRYRWPRIAPNGRSLAMGEVPRGGFGDIVVAELGSGRKVRLASPGQQGGEAVWRPDGLLLTGWGRGGSALFELFSHSPDGASPPARFLAGPMDLNATSWSADGRFLLVAATGPETDGRYDVYVREPDGRLRRFVGGPGDQRAGQFSPDGRWVAYSSGEGGRTEILVTDWPAASRRWTVSSGGGSDPVWARDGRELFYRSGDRMMAVAVASTGPFSAGEPRELFRGPFLIDPFGDQSYDVAADGRFLMIERTPGVQVDLQVTVNWLPELRRLLR